MSMLACPKHGQAERSSLREALLVHACLSEAWTSRAELASSRALREARERQRQRKRERERGVGQGKQCTITEPRASQAATGKKIVALCFSPDGRCSPCPRRAEREAREREREWERARELTERGLTERVLSISWRARSVWLSPSLPLSISVHPSPPPPILHAPPPSLLSFSLPSFPSLPSSQISPFTFRAHARSVDWPRRPEETERVPDKGAACCVWGAPEASSCRES